jgi:hypothetical protein
MPTLAVMTVSNFSKRTLALLTDVLPGYFTATGLETLFMVCGIEEPAHPMGGLSKQRRVLDVVKSLLESGDEKSQQALDLVRELTSRLPVENDPRGRRLDEKEQRFLNSVHTDGWQVVDGKVEPYPLLARDVMPRGPAPASEVSASVEVTAPAALTSVAAPLPSIPSSLEVDLATSRRVFIVHGRQPLFKQVVARFVEHQQYEAVILDEQVDQGVHTIFEKFLDEAADAAFAVAILTPEDVGRLKDEQQDQPRARQNVIFELGYFIALLGRDRVAVLMEASVEMPSDLAGVITVPIDMESDAWKMPLARAMKAAGLVINFEAI